ncbi:hypothetical protein MCOR24_011472 [Pyricularia oryzae]|nr:hypothetical protein MCOR24_011472 [Pyricularia oryzae]KAI6574208.1 hypothetical protein MCOR09_002415 [Pyricularia oryzae]
MSSSISASTAQGQPPGHVGWVPPPRGRGTINILWSCLSVLLICSYKCLHLNIAAADELEAGWHKVFGIPYWPERPKLRCLLRKFKWMVVIILAPEIGVGMAATQYFEARQDVAEATDEAPDFALWLSSRDKLTVDLGDEPVYDNIDAPVGHLKEGFTLTHAFYARMGGLVLLQTVTDAEGRAAVRKTRITKLKDYAIFLRKCSPARRQDFLLSETEIQAMGKSDALTKAFAVWQALYLVLDCAARTVADLPISPLELSAAGYVLAAAVMYGFWWLKPQDVGHITVLRHVETMDRNTTDASTPIVTSSRREKHMSFGDLLSFLLPDKSFKVTFTFHIIAASFGGVHVAAWYWDFGSDTIVTAWRVSSIVSTTMPLATVAGGWFGYALDNLPDPNGTVAKISRFITSILYLLLIMASPISYAAARLCLVVLSFYSLASMPEALYKTVAWTDYLPFIS